MRGKAVSDAAAVGVWGITPAHAGKSRILWDSFKHFMDHPRACGEKGRSSVHDLRRLGSPPRMRGKAALVIGFDRRIRITPAHAGKSWQLKTK